METPKRRGRPAGTTKAVTQERSKVSKTIVKYEGELNGKKFHFSTTPFVTATSENVEYFTGIHSDIVFAYLRDNKATWREVK